MSPHVTSELPGDDVGETTESAQSDDPAPFLRAAVSLLQLGRAAEAVRAASEACHRAPRLAQAHYVYGQSWLALNESAKAERAFAEAIRLAPAWADAWVNYGIARYRQGAIEDAKTAMRQALVHAPGHRAATANLGAFMRISGESEATKHCARKTRAQSVHGLKCFLRPWTCA